MSYFLFTKNLPNLKGTLYKITENLSDLNFDLNPYDVIEVTENEFNNVRLNIKFVVDYDSNNQINYGDCQVVFKKEIQLINYITELKNKINLFLKFNPNHPLYNTWSNYYSQLTNLNTSAITYPLEMSLEQYFNNLGQPALNPLQLP